MMALPSASSVPFPRVPDQGPFSLAAQLVRIHMQQNGKYGLL